MDLQTFNQIAELGKLTFSDTERDELLTDMTEIIDIMDTVKNADLVYDPLKDNKNVFINELRKDRDEPSFATAKILQNARNMNNCFVVPKVVE
ncbi:MAG: Asp-tRNA(Asn)/Glu-tRNA(Gln) amidotransferase GatCAB subunit C [Ruminococcus sp.]|jgi:aspartyl-tRNA(Asn)/glutamyl-tRNA(Gln) amidotransferase subunit C|nr:Asp-tRNA(Asn)/Glu-tRNA(Gln) amidotransferase GatCAB subunit C [Ruminococcus sp.]